MKKDKEKKASILKMSFLLAQTFSYVGLCPTTPQALQGLIEKLYQQTFFLKESYIFSKGFCLQKSFSTGSFFRKKVFVLLFILALASSMCPTASAGGYGDGCLFDNFYNGTLAHGGIYFECKGWYDDEGTTETVIFENVPDSRQIVRFYPGIWTGSPLGGATVYFSIDINGNLKNFSYVDNNSGCWSDPICNVTTTPPGCNVSITGCGCDALRYNDAAPDIGTGDNTISFWTNEQIYQFSLLTVYENKSKPQIQYWIKEGHDYPDEDEPYYVYFNETANTGKIYLGSLKSAEYWNYGYPHLLGTPELNGHDIGEHDIKRDNTYDTIFYGWLNIPADYITAPSNEFKYEGFTNARMMVAVLVLNYYEPSNLTVTDISPESLIVNRSNAIDAKIVNYGKTARFFNVTLCANDEVVDVKRVKNLGEGENRTVKLFWKPSATDSYVLNVTADVENVVLETDETNNSKTLDVTVTEASPPAWSNQSSNVSSIPNGGTIELRAQGKADVGLEKAILCTDETGDWESITDGRYGSPLNMAFYYNYSVTHTSNSDWDNQTIYNLSIVDVGVRLGQYGTGSENIAREKTNYSSSENEGYKEYKWKANDGDPYSGWCSADGDMPCWWYVDLGNVKDINKISFYGYAYSTPLKYKILISNDNETWTEKIVRYSTTNEVTPDTYTQLGWSCRYINVTVTKNDYGGGQTWGGFAELEAYPPLGYNPDGTLTSKTIETDNPIISVMPTWNATVPTATSLSVNISVDSGATWKNATNGTELTWDYDGNNTNLKYKVLFESTDVTKTPVLHDIMLNYTTEDPVESEWLWSNFTWQNASIPDGTTVSWKIYYEDMLGQTNCTAVKTFNIGEEGVANVSVKVNYTSFGNVLAGDNTTIYLSLRLNNTGTAPATIEAVFKTNVGEIYGLNGTDIYIIPGNYFELGPDGSEKALTNTASTTIISTLPAGATAGYNAILIVPAGQAADDYSGIVELSW